MWVFKIMQSIGIGEIMSPTILMHFTGNPSIPDDSVPSVKPVHKILVIKNETT